MSEIFELQSFNNVSSKQLEQGYEKRDFLTLCLAIQNFCEIPVLCDRRVSKVEMCVLKPCVCTMGISVMAVSFVSVKVHNKKKEKKNQLL